MNLVQFRPLASTLLLFVCSQPVLLAQSPTSDSNQSWTATSEQQLPSGDKTRSSESHSEKDGRTVDKQTVERMGMYGKSEPYLDREKETVKVDANTVRTILRTYGRDSEGNRILTQVTEEERRTSPGESKVVSTTSNPDVNGNLQVVQRETQQTKTISANIQETKSSVFLPGSSGGLALSLQTEERRTKTSDHDLAFKKSTLLPDGNGGWQLGEVRVGTVKDDGTERKTEERVLQPGSDGQLAEVQRTVKKELSGQGEKKETTETYSTGLSEAPGDTSLQLSQRVTTVHRTGQDGRLTTEQETQSRNPAQPNDGLQITQKAIDIVRPGLSGTRKETRTVQSLDANGNLGVVYVDTTTQDKAPAIQVDIAPAKSK